MESPTRSPSAADGGGDTANEEKPAAAPANYSPRDRPSSAVSYGSEKHGQEMSYVSYAERQQQEKDEKRKQLAARKQQMQAQATQREREAKEAKAKEREKRAEKNKNTEDDQKKRQDKGKTQQKGGKKKDSEAAGGKKDKSKQKQEKSKDESAKTGGANKEGEKEEKEDGEQSARDKEKSGSGKKTSSRQEDEESTGGESFLTEGDTKRHELRALERQLKEEKRKAIENQRQKDKDDEEFDFMPDVFNNLDPYTNTYSARHAFEEEKQKKYYPREKYTALTLVDPWVSLTLDTTVDKKEEKPPPSPRKPKEKKEKEEKPPGSHRFPEIHRINMNETEKPYLDKDVKFTDVPKIRQDIKERYGSEGEDRKQKDYRRTKDDFYRMELHKMEDIAPESRKGMAKIYKAYLTTNPGSKEAVEDCIREVEDKLGETLSDEPTEQKEETPREDDQYSTDYSQDGSAQHSRASVRSNASAGRAQ